MRVLIGVALSICVLSVASAVSADDRALGPIGVTAIARVTPETTVPVNVPVEIHGITVVVDADAGRYIVTPREHAWSVRGGQASLQIVDPDARVAGTSTKAIFTAQEAGQYVVRLQSFIGSTLVTRDLPITVIDIPPSVDYWKSIGPGPFDDDQRGFGQTNAIAIVHDDPAVPPVLYAGSASGGVWKNEGDRWRPLTDGRLFRNGIGTMAIGAIAADPHDANVVYVGTGGPNCCARGPGLGVFRSRDGGRSWVVAGKDGRCDNAAMSCRIVSKLLLQPDMSTTVIAATDSGLFRSTDGGDCWVKEGKALPPLPQQLPQLSSVTDVVMSPKDPAVLYAAFSADGLYKKTVIARPASVIWTKLAGGLPTGRFARVALAIAPSNHNVLYAGFEVTDAEHTFRVFGTEDGGAHWDELTEPVLQGCDGQCGHNMVLAVDPQEANRIFVGQVPMFRSDDRGSAWFNTSGPLTGYPLVKGIDIHADNHAIVFDPSDPLVMYVADDGGIVKGIFDEVGGTLTWATLNEGFVTGQFSGVATSPGDADVAAGGVWHNGNVLTRNGGTTWQGLGGGDGAQAGIDAGTSDIVYIHTNAGFGGDVSVHNTATGEEKQIVDDISKKGGKFWSDPFRPGNLLVSLDHKLLLLKKADLADGSAVIITPPATKGAVTAATFARPASAADPAIYFVGTAATGIYRGVADTAGAVQWSTILRESSTGEINAIALDASDPSVLFVTVAGVLPRAIFRCTKNSSGWDCPFIDGGFPASETTPRSVNDILVDPFVKDTVFIATNQGVYRGHADEAAVWSWAISPGMPSTLDVTDLDLQPSLAAPAGRVIRAATWGRGIWQFVRAARPPIGVPDSVSEFSLIETGDSELQGRLIAARVRFAYTGGHGNVTLRASVMNGNHVMSGFTSTTPQLADASGEAVLLIGYVDPSGPLSLDTDGLLLELLDGEQRPFVSNAVVFRKTWRQDTARVLRGTSRIIGMEGSPPSFNNPITVRSGGRSNTQRTPFELLETVGTAVTLEAPPSVSIDGRELLFHAWKIGDEVRPQREITVIMNANTSVVANYRAAESESERLQVAVQTYAAPLCDAAASYQVDVIWSASARNFPVTVTTMLFAPNSFVDQVNYLPANGMWSFDFTAEERGIARIVVTAQDGYDFRISAETAVELLPCDP